MYKGVDTAARFSKTHAKILADNGITFVGRYLVNPTQSKAITDTEAKALHDAGLAILLIYETYAARAREGEQAGKQDGYAAYSFAKQLGVPDGAAIYFAVDYNAVKSDYPAIEAYLYAAKAACAPYRCGVYGHCDLVNSIKADCYMQCVAWSGGLLSEKANIYQYQWQGGPESQAITKLIGGIPVDMNQCADLNAAGMWMPNTPEPWYATDMKWIKEHGIMNDGRPNDSITRAEAAAMFHRFYDKFIK